MSAPTRAQQLGFVILLTVLATLALVRWLRAF